MSRHQVALFLRLVEEAHSAHRLSYRRTRDKNRETLAALGWLPSQMYECVARLDPSQALASPRRSSNPEHPEDMVCEFGTEVSGRRVYVKVTVRGYETNAAGCVISFHFAEKPFEFPFK